MVDPNTMTEADAPNEVVSGVDVRSHAPDRGASIRKYTTIASGSTD